MFECKALIRLVWVWGWDVGDENGLVIFWDPIRDLKHLIPTEHIEYGRKPNGY